VISQHIPTKFSKIVLLLGSSSFIGKNIIAKIPYKKIVCVQLKKNEISNKKNLKYYFYDLLDYKKIKRIINQYKFDIVIICAANNNNSLNLYNKNIDIFQQNTNILLNILECCKFKKKIQIINFTSTETLKKNNSIYSIAKRANNELCQFYQKNYNLKIKNLILPNLFGQNDLNFNRIIPMLIKNFLLKKKIIIRNYSIKLKLVFIDSLLEMLINQKKYCSNKIALNQIIKKIKYLNNSFNSNFFKSTFDYQLYQTLIWYKNYFKKK
jgi:nucleoside-diphosphate-sugar epimerase